ncbi:amidohydrolase [Haloglycomyces albus]|uniref:amidohydrolase n=1 Tax=Haloglycomyces albus TaxID=526067 RepID=UPI00046CD06C|nr:amidohydrolase [Haloglycomyces albus]
MADNTFALTGATVLPITGEAVPNGTVVVEDGVITAVGGSDTSIPSGTPTHDVNGKYVTPGLVDAHTHLGVHEEAAGTQGSDVNELTDPNTADVRALDAIFPADIGFDDARSGGVLTVGIMPGSGNIVGGQAVAVNTHGRTVEEMLLREPTGVKSALGENPKRVYGGKDKKPSTRLGNAAMLRSAFVEAGNYLAKIENAEDENTVERDLRNEIIGKVLKRELPWRQHSHRADDIATAIRVSEEFGYRLVIDHGTEGYLIADLLAEKNIPVANGPLLTSRSKMELRNRTLRGPGLLHQAGVEVSIITDHPVIPINQLITQVILSIKAGLDRDYALRTVTINPAAMMGIDDKVGSLESGKHGTLCVWSGDPLDIYSEVERAFIKGTEVDTSGA